MARKTLKETRQIDKIELLTLTGQIQIREIVTVTRGDELVSASNHRRVIEPEQAVDDEAPLIRAIRAAMTA